MARVATPAATAYGALDAGQLARLVDQLPVLLWSTDTQLRVTSRRGGGLSLLGSIPSPPSEDGLFVGRAVDNPAEAARAVAAHRAALLGNPTAYEINVRGRTFSARVEPLRDARGAICGVAGMAFDITDLRYSEERLRVINLATNDAVWDWDLVTNALWFGRGFETLFWYTREELEPTIEARTNRVHPEDRDRVLASLKAAIDAGNTIWSGDYRFRRRDGSYADVYDRGYVIHDPRTGTPIRMVGSMMDVSERKRSQEQLQASRAALRLLAARQHDVREHERTRIAREIHDTLGQALTALKLQLAAAQTAAGPAAPALRERLSETALMVDDLVKTVRRIVTELRPPILDQLGLPAAVEWLAQDFSRRTGIACESTILPTDDAITNELATALFRITQEALTNISRHAAATRAQVELGLKSGCVTLEVLDDGQGITEAAASGPGSLGILGMRERAAALGGVLEVAPRSDGGTRVAAWFPSNPGVNVNR
jgi:two-component system, NarL family, sensor histidine kinase UhpB